MLEQNPPPENAEPPKEEYVTLEPDENGVVKLDQVKEVNITSEGTEVTLPDGKKALIPKGAKLKVDTAQTMNINL